MVRTRGGELPSDLGKMEEEVGSVITQSDAERVTGPAAGGEGQKGREEGMARLPASPHGMAMPTFPSER